MKRRKANFDEKKLYSVFFKETKEVRDDKDSWLWLQKGVLKKETEGLVLAAQEQALRASSIKKMIDKQDCSTKCRMCDERDETVVHIVSECSRLAQMITRSADMIELPQQSIGTIARNSVLHARRNTMIILWKQR